VKTPFFQPNYQTPRAARIGARTPVDQLHKRSRLSFGR
jgi:hypothetical protein